jgi:hypothetical protein
MMISFCSQFWEFAVAGFFAKCFMKAAERFLVDELS